MKNARQVALLPMKANSVRVTGKNFREFAGKPLFRWILDTLLALDEIELVVINTDARAILAEKGLQEGGRVRIRDRKAELCGDSVSMNLILADDLAAVPAELYLMTHTTNPLLSRDTLRAALAEFRRARAAGAADSLFSVNRHQSRFYRPDGQPINHDPARLIPTQELEPWYEENSNLYLFTAESFRATSARIGRKPMMYPTPKFESLDIDTPADWTLAELAARARLAELDAAGGKRAP
jgi:CMP-N-acetylneuraminic acid synthetase